MPEKEQPQSETFLHFLVRINQRALEVLGGKILFLGVKGEKEHKKKDNLNPDRDKQ